MNEERLHVDSLKDPLIVESIGDSWALSRPFSFYYEKADGERIYVTVPQGFVTDFASTPSWTYSFFPPVGIYNKAMMLHDYLYDVICPLDITRRQADRFMLQAMKILGVSKIARYLMYYGVRLGGRSRFRKAT
jgi:hypothetical protein